MADDEPAAKKDSFDSLTRAQLIALLRKQEHAKKLGLVWERDAIAHDKALNRSFASARLIPDQCERPAPWENLVIEGDNFDALRWLRMAYRGMVKCIYIDPPYNTGNKDWVYNDDYVDKTDRYRHSTWLEFLYQRLLIARDLMAEDGVMLISINDENRARLELMADEALPGMKVGSLVWRTRNGSNADQVAYLSPDHEHILVYSSSSFQFAGTEKSYKGYDNPDSDPRGDWQPVSMKLGFSYIDRPNLYYPIKDPETGIWYPCNPDEVWRYARSDRVRVGQRLQTQPIEDWIAQDRIRFPADQRVEQFTSESQLMAAIDSGDVPKSGRTPLLRRGLPDLEFWIGKKIGYGTPRRKLFRSELRRSTQPLSSWIAYTPDEQTEGSNRIHSGSAGAGSTVVKQLFGKKAFDHPKPLGLIRGVVQQAVQPGDLVLDFFAGSATTAQAVMELNAEDGGGRRFIMVSSTEATKDEPDKNLCRDVTAERIRRLNANEDKYADLSAGFAYLRMDTSDTLFIDDAITPAAAWNTLEAMHDLPLTEWADGEPHALHAAEHVTLALVDRVSDGFAADLAKARNTAPVFVYAFAPGQVERLGLPDVEIRNIRETLEKRFFQ
ncbi:MAG: site-specific DNA-methyltransferase [Pseudomonadota bacterium]